MSRVITRRLVGRKIGDAVLLDAIEHQTGDQRSVTLFFDQAADVDQMTGPDGATLLDRRTIAKAPILHYQIPMGTKPVFQVADQSVDLTLAETETALFEGENTALATRNGESAQVVLDWLAYHHTHHGMQGAVILDRARPGSDNGFAKALQTGLRKRKLPCTVVIVSSDLPMGKPDLPPEAHPFCVSEAPGKDRMTIPAPAPWTAPLGALTWFEIAKTRFLADARAVTNIDVHDLIPRYGPSVFDRAVSAHGGLITLTGKHCYPWRVRNGKPALFADHICVQFDATGGRTRWCIAPAKAPENAVWRMLRIGNAAPDPKQAQMFYRHMALRHPADSISKIVPKTSLIEDADLLAQAQDHFGHDPVRVPEIAAATMPQGRGRRAIVTTMKNEGPFILEWLAYHRAIGFDDILVYTNDCDDGTDDMLDLLMRKGLVEHRINQFRQMDLKPQHAALQMAEDEPLIQQAKWVTCIDVDEYVNIKVGDGTLDALFDAVPDANMIAMTWRLFGNGDVHGFEDRPITAQFQHCAPELARKPHQAWGFKTLFANTGIFKKLGVHRPKGLNPQLWEKINWVNGSGAALPRDMYRNGWRSTTDTYGYDMVQLNHYAVRSAESFLVKRDRGRVNHVDRDQGLSYWFRMNHNVQQDASIQRHLPMMQAELDRLMADPEIAAAHAHSVVCHKAKIVALRETSHYAAFYDTLTSARLQKLSRLLPHFGANVFLSGPTVIPDDVVARDPDADWFFTVEMQGETTH